MFKINEKRLFKTFKDLASIPSPSGKEKEVIKYIQDELKKIKITSKKVKCGNTNNLLIKVKATGKKQNPIMLSCHSDTVTPCEKINVIETDTKITTDGTSILGGDDKAAIAAILEGLKYLKENNIEHGPIEILVSCEEEIGLIGAKNMDYSLIDSKRAIVLDSDGPIGTVTIAAPYHYSMEINIKGKAAHAGMEPENGISAIVVLSQIICKLPNGRIDKGTTLNVGKINGGRANNIVAENASLSLEFRSLDKNKGKKVEKDIKLKVSEICKKYKAKGQVKCSLQYAGFKIADNNPLMTLFKKAADKIKIKTNCVESGGGSDTNIFNANGINAINMSIGMSKVHTTEEFIKKSDLVKTCRLLLSILDEA